MDAQKSSQTKLTRTQSSLLRSSPTIRSSIHSLTSVAEEDVIKTQQQQQHQQLGEDLEEQKKVKPHRSGSTPRSTGSTRFTPVLTLVSLIFVTLFSLSFFFFFYLRREEIPTSENLLLALIFIAITLFFASKNKKLINQNLIVFKQLWEESTKRLNFSISRTKSKQVQWFIGDPNASNNSKGKKLDKRIIREGVEFYSNGDSYEGEFHKGKCNGSGVYNFFVNGTYEGDWIDGRYDGYGIESWARGSRYRGQYRQGLRHGYGVYRLVLMRVAMLVNSSVLSNTALVFTISGMEIDMPENILETKCTALVFITSPMATATRDHGMKDGSKAVACILSAAATPRCGEWNGGTLKTPSPYLSDAVVRVVQAARKTAERAVHLRRVDELVNKAVHAANRAATAARVAAVKAVQNRMDGKFCETNV
ncbi:hypothetical protein OIU78_022173 [Salix suchowensis]|nr:hypothetical protein OIU78_022173 [Salix suchowensis]